MPAFWDFSECYSAEMEKDELRQDWHRFEKREMKEKHVGGKGSTEENTN